MSLDHLVSHEDFRAAARERLDPHAYDYFRSGALTERTLAANEAAFRRWRFRKRVMVDVSTVEVAATVLGTPVSSPVLVAPTAFHRLADPDGEVATARAARAAGTIMVASTLATAPVEEVAATGASLWFQLYVLRDRDLTTRLVQRAAAAGCTAIVLTVDAPLMGIRYADQRNRFQLPPGMALGNLAGDLPEVRGSGLRAFSEQFDQSLTWADVAWVCATSGLPVVVKGVLSDDDARRAVDAGAAGVVVSNHGGRQLDGDPATLDVLGEVVAAIGGQVPVLVDGGVRTGPDVLMALALGAEAVLVGRPVLWGLAAAGEAGVVRVLGLLREELVDALRQAGVPGLAALREVGADLLRPAP